MPKTNVEMITAEKAGELMLAIGKEGWDRGFNDCADAVIAATKFFEEQGYPITAEIVEKGIKMARERMKL